MTSKEGCAFCQTKQEGETDVELLGSKTVVHNVEDILRVMNNAQARLQGNVQLAPFFGVVFNVYPLWGFAVSPASWPWPLPSCGVPEGAASSACRSHGTSYIVSCTVSFVTVHSFECG